ncbi:MAG TPA: beta-ketoacyl-[acyl-carrier-protein] synthase family protein [Polyangiaceae bacterium]|nr:beta-ketoacyl-[acyl-carrier-protein] synthase family protein [Polyangiaceae bacterium]
MTVAITGYGAVSSLGGTADAMWSAIVAGRDGIDLIDRFDTSGLASAMGALVKDAGSEGSSADRALDFAVRAANEARAHAKLGPGASRVALVLGTSLGSSVVDLAALASSVAARAGAHGARIVISTACSSSTHAVGVGRDLLDANLADVVLAGGTDELSPEIFAGFCALGVVAKERCAPFGEVLGTSLGEGAGFVVLERSEDATRRGTKPIAYVAGYGISADAYHATSPDPSGAGVARAIRSALGDAGLAPADIDYVNAHGTGTAANDAAEVLAIASALGDGARLPAISSSKSFLGHAQGAAGILELVTTLMGMERGVVPPTMGFTRARPRCPADPIAGRSPRSLEVARAISLSSAFGGANASVIVSRAPSTPDVLASRAIFARGSGVVLPGAATLGDLEHASLARSSGRAPEIAIERVLRGVDPRGLDVCTRLLAKVTVDALASAGLSVKGDRREKVGLFVGQTRVSDAASREFHGSVAERGLARLSASAFAKMVLNASASAVTRMVGLRGAVTAISTGASSGLAVVALAALHLRRHAELDALVVAGVHEIAEAERLDAAEGAAATVLVRAPDIGDGALVQVDVRALDAPGRALAAPAGVWSISADACAAESGGLGGALAFVVACERVRRGLEPAAWVTGARGSASVAIEVRAAEGAFS